MFEEKSIAQIFSNAILPNYRSVGINSFWNKADWEYRPGPMYTYFWYKNGKSHSTFNYTRGEFLGVPISSGFSNTWKLKCL